MNQADRDFFAQNGYINLGQVLDAADLKYFHDLFEEDRKKYPYFWRHYGHHQEANYDALITTPKFDELIRHPKILPVVEELMGSPVCFGEIGLRWMGPYDGEFHQGWHRDKPHWLEHPLRMDYIQLMAYFTDVDEGTHCISFSPESLDQKILKDNQAQLDRGGVYNLHGPAGDVRVVQRLCAAYGDYTPHACHPQDGPNLLRSPRPRAARQRFWHPGYPLA